jgi:hypothetical protein
MEYCHSRGEIAIMIQMDAIGLDKALAQLKALGGFIGMVKGAEFYGRTRRDSGKNNADVLDWLTEGGRDIQKMGSKEMDRAAKALAKEAERRLQHLPTGISQKRAVEILAAAYRDAGKEILEILTERIKKEITSDGNQAKKVTPEYAAERRRKYGVPDSAVFKATGQLLDNVNPSNNNVSRIKILIGRIFGK